MKKKPVSEQNNGCTTGSILALKDTMNVINGKWKAAIIYSLAFGKKRYGELQKAIPRINPRMLSKELRDLEANGIITRTVYDSYPVVIEYQLTKSGLVFKKDVLDVMLNWGLKHRKSTLGK